MANTYQAKTKAGEGVYQPGVFEHEFTPGDENDAIRSGLLEIVPRAYKVIGTSRVYETAPGEEFEAALPIETEAALIAGGHIKRVDKKQAITKKKED